MVQMLGVTYDLETLLDWNLSDIVLDNASRKNKHLNWKFIVLQTWRQKNSYLTKCCPPEVDYSPNNQREKEIGSVFDF